MKIGVHGDCGPMATECREHVIVPWGSEDRETKILTFELPSRELLVQAEVPTDVLERMADRADQHGISTAQALAERLEINRARLSVRAAQAATDLTRTRTHLSKARELLSDVEALDTSDIERDIEGVWDSELDVT